MLPGIRNKEHLFAVPKFTIEKGDVKDFMLELKKRGVDSRPFFYPMSDMPYLNEQVNTPVTHEVYKRGINLPTYFDLTEEQVKFVCETVKTLLHA